MKFIWIVFVCTLVGALALAAVVGALTLFLAVVLWMPPDGADFVDILSTFARAGAAMGFIVGVFAAVHTGRE